MIPARGAGVFSLNRTEQKTETIEKIERVKYERVI